MKDKEKQRAYDRDRYRRLKAEREQNVRLEDERYIAIIKSCINKGCNRD